MLTKAKAAGVFWFFALIGTFFLLGMAGPPEASAQDTNYNLTVDKTSQSSGTGTVTATWDGVQKIS